MKKIFSWLSENLLFVLTLFLLAFIPLYPKLPLIDIRNTWVYIRAEDFVILSVLFIWFVYLIRKKVTLKTPLTLPILVFWLIGGLATIHGVLLIFPTLANVFPNVAFLNYIRHIEYLSLFFVAFSAVSDKRFLKVIILVLSLTMLGVIAYGFGQRFLGFPAYLTMNEEFAKGIPIQLSELSRVPSTFAGHYDLAAYLVLLIPVFASLFFGFKNWAVKIAMALIVIFGFILLFMTVSRVSFFVLILSLILVLFFYKKRLVLFTIPILIVAGLIFASFQSSLFQRFGNTVEEVNVLIDAKTGEAIGHVNYVDASYFNDKRIGQQKIDELEELSESLEDDFSEVDEATPSALLPRRLFSDQTPLVRDVNVSNGEFLPQGTSYINLSLSPVDKKLTSFFYEITQESDATTAAEIIMLHGDFLVKRAAAYDLSFTTRFQGEWPNAIAALEQNIFLGSGYGSISLAIDNNYLRMLGEVGSLGTIAFLGVFVAFGIYIKKILPHVDSKLARSFILGIAAGVIGLSLNAILIDVFEASKIAFVLWMLVGITVGLLSFYKTESVNMTKELLKALSSPAAIIIYLSALVIIVNIPLVNNYFVADDFTWLRWAADCSAGGSTCVSLPERLLSYFTNSEGFFYRPGTKVYFLLMYTVFWLNQLVFHLVSISLHLAAVVLFFLLAKKILKTNGLAALASVLFIFMSGYTENIFWISSVGHLANAVFLLAAILTYSLWEEKRKVIYLAFSILFITLGLLFHEVGVVAPLLIGLYKFITNADFKIKKVIKDYFFLLTFSPVIIYLVARLAANSHWSGGDYSYNLVKLPLNVAGNILGYIFITYLGPISLPIYQNIRELFKNNISLSLVGLALGVVAIFLVYRFAYKKLATNDKKILIFGLLFFVISLLPFLALGNITSRYSYLASFGLVIILAYLVNKLYVYLKEFGKEVALLSISVIILVFALFHIIQVQQLHKDWRTAGDITNKFFISIDSLYEDSWESEDVELYFVNVPIKHNDAWVFPVGLEDAVWLTFQNPNLKTSSFNDLNEAVRSAGLDSNKVVLLFDEGGNVNEVSRFRNRITGELDYKVVEE